VTRRSAQIAIALCLLGLIDVNSATALQESTHAIVNEQASRHSQLDQFLKAQLGFPEGIEESARTMWGGPEVFFYAKAASFATSMILSTRPMGAAGVPGTRLVLGSWACRSLQSVGCSG
jgi:hypothetical protein